jgi:hypothetical protein
MAHFLQALAQHWHLSASHYWQLRLLCAIGLGPLLGVLCLLVIARRQAATARVVQRVRQLRRIIVLRPLGSRPHSLS